MVYTGLYISLIFSIFCFVGAYLSKYISSDKLEILTSFIYFSVGIFFLVNSYSNYYGNKCNNLKTVWS